MNLSKEIKISSAITPTAGVAGTTEIDGAILDMSGFEGVLIEVRFGAITSGAVTVVKAQQDTDPTGGTMADIAGSAQAVADSSGDKVFYLDLYRPQKRYVRLVVSRGTQNAVVASATYHQYEARVRPTVQGASVAGKLLVSPDEGTA